MPEGLADAQVGHQRREGVVGNLNCSVNSGVYGNGGVHGGVNGNVSGV